MMRFFKNGWVRCTGFVCLALMAAIPSVLFWPMDVLTVRDDHGKVVLCTALVPGCNFTTLYIHSVQLSPVIDEFFVQNELIWLWHSRVQGHNAGLPTLPPERGRVYLSDPWVIFEGTIASFAEYAQRVGNDRFGQNLLRIGNGSWQPLYKTQTNKRLHLTASRLAMYRL